MEVLSWFCSIDFIRLDPQSGSRAPRTSSAIGDYHRNGFSALSAVHAVALIGATPASRGALLAMVHLMFAALIRTSTADISTQAAKRGGKLAPSCHVGGT